MSHTVFGIYLHYKICLFIWKPNLTGTPVTFVWQSYFCSIFSWHLLPFFKSRWNICSSLEFSCPPSKPINRSLWDSHPVLCFPLKGKTGLLATETGCWVVSKLQRMESCPVWWSPPFSPTFSAVPHGQWEISPCLLSELFNEWGPANPPK